MTCISDLYYKIGHWFTLIFLLIAFITLPITLSILDSPISFFMCTAFAFIGVACEFKDKFVYPIHYGAACISTMCALIFVSMLNIKILLFMPFWIIPAIIDKYRWLLFAELSIIQVTFMCIFLELIK